MLKKVINFMLIFLFVAQATALADSTKDKLNSLENMIKEMRDSSIERNEKVASALSTIEQIKLDYQAIQGAIEANNHMANETQAEMHRLRTDIGARISAIEERMEIYDDQIMKAVAKVLPKAVDEIEAYKNGLDMVQDGDFLSAVSSFRKFLKTYPSSNFADNAQFWVGECYYALRDYPKAIKEFQVVSDKYSKSNKIAASVLKQGLAFSEMGMADETKPFLKKVIKNYPGSDESIHAQEKLDRLDNKEALAKKEAQPAGAANDSNSDIPLAPGVKVQPAKAANNDNKDGVNLKY